jgi:hypothetical protein
MKRSIAARKPARVVSSHAAHPAVPETNLPANATPSVTQSAEMPWDRNGPAGAPVPVIRANMISFRVSYQGRVQVAFFEEDEE